jgi:hypothetical protein
LQLFPQHPNQDVFIFRGDGFEVWKFLHDSTLASFHSLSRGRGLSNYKRRYC